MIWRFAGEKLERRLSAEGETSFFLEAAWHMPLFDMGGPSPPFDVDAVLEVFRRGLYLHIKVGEPQDVIGHATTLLRISQGKQLPSPNYAPHSVVSTAPGCATEIVSVVSSKMMAEVVAAFRDYSAASGPKCFGGTLAALGLFTGPNKRDPSREEVVEFMNGKRAALADEVPSLSFTFGEPLPAAPSERDLLNKLQQQFR